MMKRLFPGTARDSGRGNSDQSHYQSARIGGRRIPFTGLYRDREEMKRIFLESPLQYEDAERSSLMSGRKNIYGQVVDQQSDGEQPILPVSGMLAMLHINKGFQSSRREEESARIRSSRTSARTTASTARQSDPSEDVRFI